MQDLVTRPNIALPPENETRLILTGEEGLKSMTSEFNYRAENTPHGRYLAQWQLFVEAHDWPEMKKKIEKRLAEIIHRDNIFTPVTRLEETLRMKIYGLDQAPRLMRLPEQRVEMVARAYRALRRVREELSRGLIGKFIGNAYTLDFSQRVGIGTGGITLQDLHDNFPGFYKQMIGDIPPAEIQDLRLPTYDERRLAALFNSMTTEADLPNILKLFDYPDAQPPSARIVCGDWDLYKDEFEGVAYTDCYTHLNGQVAKTWPTNQVHRDWAVPHSQLLGTVSDFIKAGLIDWPGPKQSQHPFRDAFLSAASLMFKAGRKARKEDNKFAEDVKAIQKAVTGAPALPRQG